MPRLGRISRIALPTLLTLYLLGILNVFLRNSTGVFGPELAVHLSVAPAFLGGVASAFFFAYALMQVPTGILLDRYGAKPTIGCLMIVTTAGSALFAVAGSPALLIIARVLMGIGCAGCFTGAFFIFAHRVPRDRFAFHGGLFNSIAMMGTLLAATPLAAATAVMGWRHAALAMAGLAGLAMILTWALLREDPAEKTSRNMATRETLADSMRGLLEVIRIPGMGRLVCAGVGMSAAPVISSLWGGPYLHDVQGLDDLGRGNVLLFMATMGVLSHFTLGQVSTRCKTLRGVIVGGTTVVIAALGLLAVLESPPLWLVTMLFGVISFGCGYPAIIHAHIRAMVPERLIGRGITSITMGATGLGALMQTLVGTILGAFPVVGGMVPEIGYRTAFAFMTIVIAGALMVYAGIDDGKPALSEM